MLPRQGQDLFAMDGRERMGANETARPLETVRRNQEADGVGVMPKHGVGGDRRTGAFTSLHETLWRDVSVHLSLDVMLATRVHLARDGSLGLQRSIRLPEARGLTITKRQPAMVIVVRFTKRNGKKRNGNGNGSA